MDRLVSALSEDKYYNSDEMHSTVVLPTEMDETTGDSGIGLDMAQFDGDQGQLSDRPFQSVTAQPDLSTSWQMIPYDRPNSISGSTVSADCSGCSLVGDLIDDTSSRFTSIASSPLNQSFPSLFEELLLNSFPSVSSSTKQSSRRTSTCRRRLRSPPTGRQLQYYDECSPMSQELLSVAIVDSASASSLTSRKRTMECETRHDPDVLDEKRSYLIGDSCDSNEHEVTCVNDVITALGYGDDHVRNMTGDLSAELVLPVVVDGKHADLKTISADTLAHVLAQRYSHAIEQCHVIDCRYPYEFDGGHIENAMNVCTKEAIVETFIISDLYRRPPVSGRRTIFVFHCEFSSERAPSLLRFLRNEDRAAHSNCYPKLHYPEIYLLAGGYKAFYDSHLTLCRPPSYRSMLDSNHTAELRHFRLKSKPWPRVSMKQPLNEGLDIPTRRTAAREDGLSRRKGLWT